VSLVKVVRELRKQVVDRS